MWSFSSSLGNSFIASLAVTSYCTVLFFSGFLKGQLACAEFTALVQLILLIILMNLCTRVVTRRVYMSACPQPTEILHRCSSRRLSDCKSKHFSFYSRKKLLQTKFYLLSSTEAIDGFFSPLSDLLLISDYFIVSVRRILPIRHTKQTLSLSKAVGRAFCRDRFYRNHRDKQRDRQQRVTVGLTFKKTHIGRSFKAAHLP